MTEEDPFAVKPAEPETAADAAPVVDPITDRDVVGASTDTATHDTEHDAGLSDADARVPGDAAPVIDKTATVADPKEPLGTLPDTATATETLPVINTDVSDRAEVAAAPDDAPTLGDAVVPTKPGGADLEDIEDDQTKDLLSRAPKRAHEGLVNQLDLKWAELKHFIATVEGEIDGELGEVLAFVRSRL